jgi:hypothetical protein
MWDEWSKLRVPPLSRRALWRGVSGKNNPTEAVVVILGGYIAYGHSWKHCLDFSIEPQ